MDALTENVYLTIDVDGLDPSVVPTTGTPEPGGLLWYDLLEFLRTVAKSRRIVGMDVVELSGGSGQSNAPAFLTSKLIYKCLGYIFSGACSANIAVTRAQCWTIMQGCICNSRLRALTIFSDWPWTPGIQDLAFGNPS